jgi:hypothetical protein
MVSRVPSARRGEDLDLDRRIIRLGRLGRTGMITEPAFTARALTPDQIPQAYVLVELARIGVGPEQWRRLAAAILAESRPPRAGIMTVQNARGYIQGLFRYRVIAEVPSGASLRVDDLIAIDLFDRALAASIAGVMEALGRAESCAVVDVALPLAGSSEETPSTLWHVLRANGYRPAGPSLRKVLAAGVAA